MTRVTARLDKLALWYDYTIVCTDIKSKVISEEFDEEFNTTMCKWGLELTNPVEYTREDLLKKYDGKIKISRWAHTFTENGEPAIAVVIE